MDNDELGVFGGGALILGGIVYGVYKIFGDKVICEECEKEFGFFEEEFKCRGCSKTVCSDCLIKPPKLKYLAFDLIEPAGRCCNNCHSETNWTAINQKYEYCLDNYEQVKTYSINYEGNVPKAAGSEKNIIITDFFKDRSDAEKSLKVSAAYIECDLVTEKSFEKGKSQDGNYVHSVWRAIGTPAKLKN